MHISSENLFKFLNERMRNQRFFLLLMAGIDTKPAFSHFFRKTTDDQMIQLGRKFKNDKFTKPFVKTEEEIQQKKLKHRNGVNQYKNKI